MIFKKSVKSIQTAGYNGARPVVEAKIFDRKRLVMILLFKTILAFLFLCVKQRQQARCKYINWPRLVENPISPSHFSCKFFFMYSLVANET